MSTHTLSSRALPPGWTMQLPKLVDGSRRGKTEWMRNVLAQVNYSALSSADQTLVKRFITVQTKSFVSSMTRMFLTSRFAPTLACADPIHTVRMAEERQQFRRPYLRSALLATMFALLLGMQVVQLKDPSSMHASLVDAGRFLASVQHATLRQVKPIKSPITSFTFSSIASVPEEPGIEAILLRREERRQERMEEESAPTVSSLPNTVGTLPNGTLFAMLDEALEHQALSTNR